MADRHAVDPFEIDLLLWAHDGPRWEVAPFVHREGWLMIAVARRDTPIGEMTATLSVAVTEQGELLPYALADRLLDCPTSLPRDPGIDPPEELSEAMDGRYWDFLGRTDRECLAEFAAAEERNDKRIAAFEAECGAFETKLWAAIRELRAERRRADVTPARILEIDARLVRLLAMPDELAAGARDKVRAMRADLDAFEAAIFEALGEDAELDVLTIARWRGRTGRRADPWEHGTLRYGLSVSPNRDLAVRGILTRAKAGDLRALDRIVEAIARIRQCEPPDEDRIDALEREKQRLLRRIPAYRMPVMTHFAEQDSP